MRKVFDLTGKVFHWLTVIKRAPNAGSKLVWECSCKCGKTSLALGYKLLDGRKKSCGCLSNRMKQDGLTRKHPSEYKSFETAKYRCTNPKNPKFFDYGGRGIKFKFLSFKDFLVEVGLKPSPKHTIERINNNGHYEIGNLCWATQKQQSRNKRTTIFLTLGDQKRCLTEWSELLQIPPHRIGGRLRRGWCDDCAVTPLLKGKCPHK
jgi:hypothetical protein